MSTPKHGIMPMWLILTILLQLAIAEDHAANETAVNEEEEEEHIEPVVWILFPWFSEIIGVVTFFLLARHWHALPYTAVMFLFGTFMGIGLKRLNLTDQLTESLTLWHEINGEFLLLFFLPGLLFKDSFSANVHLMALAFNQCLTMAFPMVLAGTSLTALVAYYIFPYNWSFNLAMTLGSILSATDPVAVSALLEEVGAPPRLKVHISGEALLNDGSAMVFYTIFSSLFLYEYGIGGEEIDGTQGVKIFFRMSLGGMCIGIAFGLALLFILFILNRRLNAEENIVQVVATITIAYLTFYVAEPVAQTSGVIAVCFCGSVTKAFGIDMINDLHMMENFWILVEHLLNSLLFALGGLTWGTVIANTNKREGQWVGTDWGYLILLYVLLTVIRFLLFFGFYPFYARFGLKRRWQEAFFQSYGGLRGAVGIALAIQLDDTVFATTDNPTYREYATKLFGMVGGIAFMTLVINGTAAGPSLQMLGLANDTKMRHKIIKSFESSYKTHMLESFIQLLTKQIYHDVDFAVIRAHNDVFATLTADDIRQAVVHNKARVPAKDYNEPYVANVLRFLEDPKISSGDNDGNEIENAKAEEDVLKEVEEEVVKVAEDNIMRSSGVSSIPATPEEAPELLIELRMIFVEMLRAAYHKMVEKGELDGREGFLTFAIGEGLDFTADKVSRGRPLNDFAMTAKVATAWTEPFVRYLSRFLNAMSVCFTKSRRQVFANVQPLNPRYEKVIEHVHLAVALIRAHEVAEAGFEKEFCNCHGTAGRMERIVLEESQEQVRLAEDVLKKHPEKDVIISHLVCRILFNRSARYVGRLHASGFLKEREANKFLLEIQDSMLELYACPESHSDHEMEAGAEKK